MKVKADFNTACQWINERMMKDFTVRFISLSLPPPLSVCVFSLFVPLNFSSVVLLYSLRFFLSMCLFPQMKANSVW